MRKKSNKNLMKLFKRWIDLKDGEHYGAVVGPVVDEIEGGNIELRNAVKEMMLNIEVEGNRRLSALETLAAVKTEECHKDVRDFLLKVMADDTEDVDLHIASVHLVACLPESEQEEFIGLIEEMTGYDDHRGKVASEYLDERSGVPA